MDQSNSSQFAQSHVYCHQMLDKSLLDDGDSNKPLKSAKELNKGLHDSSSNKLVKSPKKSDQGPAHENDPLTKSYRQLDSALRKFYSAFGQTSVSVSFYASNKTQVHDGLIKRPYFSSKDLGKSSRMASELLNVLRLFTEHAYMAFDEDIKANNDKWVYARFTNQFTNKYSKESAFEQVTKAFCQLDDKITKHFYISNSGMKSITINRLIHRMPEKCLVKNKICEMFQKLLSIHKIGSVKVTDPRFNCFYSQLGYGKFPCYKNKAPVDIRIIKKHEMVKKNFNDRYYKQCCESTDHCFDEIKTWMTKLGWNEGKEYFFENCDKWIYVATTFTFTHVNDLLTANELFRNFLTDRSNHSEVYRRSCADVSMESKQLELFYFLERPNNGRKHEEK